MNWYSLADQVFAPHHATIIVLCILFVVPLIRLLTFPLALKQHWSIRLNAIVGFGEHSVKWIRDWIGIPFLVCAVGWNVYREHYIVAGIAVLLIVTNELYRMRRRDGIIAFLDFIKAHPDIHPQEFFIHYYAAFGPLGCRCPREPRRRITPERLDFQRNGSTDGRRSMLPMLKSARYMMIFTKLIITAHKARGASFARRVGSSLAVVGATRLAQLVRATITIEGAEKLKSIFMPHLYCFNHTSAFDFVIAPLLLFAHHRISGADISLAPCFLLAKDHFRDSLLLYRIIGLGRAAEILGMIFVERRKRSRESGDTVIQLAVDKLLNDTMPIAIYPQGTRARTRRGVGCTTLDGAYYAVGGRKRLKQEGNHIKRGAALIAANAALRLAREGVTGEVNLIPAAFVGAARVLPRKSIRVRKGENVTIRVGDPITVSTAMIEQLGLASDVDVLSETYLEFVNAIHHRIDNGLKTTYRVHPELERRFFEDIRDQLDHLRMEELSIAMKQWRREDYLVFVILDYIYTCPHKYWRTLLGQLAHLILTDAPRADFVELKVRVADYIPS